MSKTNQHRFAGYHRLLTAFESSAQHELHIPRRIGPFADRVLQGGGTSERALTGWFGKFADFALVSSRSGLTPLQG